LHPPSTLFLFHSVPKIFADAPGFASIPFVQRTKASGQDQSVRQ